MSEPKTEIPLGFFKSIQVVPNRERAEIVRVRLDSVHCVSPPNDEIHEAKLYLEVSHDLALELNALVRGDTPLRAKLVLEPWS